MSGELILVVAVVGLFVSFLSGLLGIGGGIVMAPALLYLPPLLGAGQLDMRAVAGLTITQGLAACLFAGLRHNKYRFVSRPLVSVMGPTILVAALSGGILSKYVPNELLLAIFAGLALVAAALMLIPKREDPNAPEAGDVLFNRPLAAAISLTIGILGGMVGQGGSFILIPLMLYVLRLPTRVAIGSNLGIVFFSSLAGFVGKAATGQVLPLLALALVAGAIPGSQFGSYVSRRTQPAQLRLGLALVVAAAAIKMCAEALR
ncbi:MAG: sulfite exporter TauE/SafE family protein [Armatimonadota bacterium]